MDADLQELRREVARAPDDPSALLALGRALARTGSRDEALAAFYRCAASGGDVPSCREALATLGAPPTPWSHVEGGASRSWRSPLRGPRRGEVVASTPLGGDRPLAVAEDGTLLVGSMTGTITRLDGASLSPLATIAFFEATPARATPVVGAGVELALCADVVFRLDRNAIGARHPAPLYGGFADLAVEGEHVLALHRVESREEPRRSGLELLDRDLAPRGVVLLGGHVTGLVAGGGRAFVAENHVAPPRLLAIELASRLTAPRRLASDATFLMEPQLDADGTVVCIASEGSGLIRHAIARFEPAMERRIPIMPMGQAVEAIALAPGGACYVAHADLLERVEPNRVRWRWAAGGGVGRPLVVDAEGVVYAGIRRRSGERSLVALAPDGTVVFELPGPIRPAAIDGRGRLLALDEARLLAIA